MRFNWESSNHRTGLGCAVALTAMTFGLGIGYAGVADPYLSAFMIIVALLLIISIIGILA